MLAGNGGQHGWANLTLLIFASGWSRRLRPAACRAIGRRRNLAGVGVSTAINWVRRLRETGSVAPGQMGGHKPKSIAGAHRAWLLEFEKIEIAALVGLADMLGIHRAVAARVSAAAAASRRRGGAQLLVADVQMDAAGGDVELDLVAVLHQSQRAADKGFRRTCRMQAP
jgi:hypothetical protein